MKLNRAIILVADSMGVGAREDAHLYGDAGSDTMGNIAKAVGGLNVPHMEAMGLGNIHAIEGVKPRKDAVAYYGKMGELSQGKDTTTGHWEMAGIVTEKGFPTYPDGFPEDVIREFERLTGRGTLGNYAASGTAIIEELGKEHMETGKLIVYTSADSVFQVAAHEEIVPLEELYRYCEMARGLLTGEHCVSRVIARPFVGVPGNFSRTEHRKDFALSPPADTLLDLLSKAGFEVTGIGKIEDIFNFRGLTLSFHTGNNHAGLERLEKQLLENEKRGLIFANLVDFDMLYGHRRNVRGYADAIEYMDAFLPRVMDAMTEGDILFITADHGCDPTFKGSDHTREFVPLLCYVKGGKGGEIGLRNSFADIAATILDLFGVPSAVAGSSFAEKLKS